MTKMTKEEQEKRDRAKNLLADLKAQDRTPLLSNWRGVVRYECPFGDCPFDSTSEPVILEHIAVMHPAPSAEDVAAWAALAEEDRLPEEANAAPETEFDPEIHVNDDKTDKGDKT